MKKVYIETNGCAVLRHETYKLAKYFVTNGYEEIDKPEIADLVVMTGCAVIKSNEDAAIEAIRRIAVNKKDKVPFIVTGCIPAIAEGISSISEDIIELKNEEMNKIDEIIDASVKLEDVYYNIKPQRHHSFGDPEVIVSESEEDCKFTRIIDKLCDSDKAYKQFCYSTRGHHLWREEDLFEIRVAFGCASNCSYCATRKGIGNFRSVSEEIILEQVKNAKTQGYDRIMLMGDEIGFWTDNEKNIVNLIQDIKYIHENARIGIRYIHPDIITRYYEELKEYFADGTITYFCAAFQSGSPRILEKMNRNPNINKFLECMADIKKNEYDVFVHTQVIVGFPTEDESDVFATLKALNKGKFDFVTVTKYSKRKGTPAAEFEELPMEIVDERYGLIQEWCELNRVNRIYQQVKKGVNQKYVG